MSKKRIAELEAKLATLERHREAVEESFKEYQHRAQAEHARLKAQLRAYTDTVVLGPYHWRALQDADPVPMPTQEGLDTLLSRLTLADALAEAVEARHRETHGAWHGNDRYVVSDPDHCMPECRAARAYRAARPRA